MASSKVCFKCDKLKRLSEFYRHPAMGDGHLGKCKECTKLDVSKHRLENIDRVREYDRQRALRPERVAYAAKISNAWRREDSRRDRCHNAVSRAVMAGRLLRKPCEWPGCGEAKSYAHHESYDRPLDVVFYCQPHHKARHKIMAIEGIEP